MHGPQTENLSRQRSCNELIANGSASEDEELPVEDQDLLGHTSLSHLPGNERTHEVPAGTQGLSAKALRRRAQVTRYIALFCACCLSIGSHYASYILGPLKSQITRELGASHTEFSLLISAYSLNSTWTPLVGGLLVSRLGTTSMSIVATGIIFLGQAFLLLGNVISNIRLMALGMFIFGLGVSPLAVVQETIIVRFFKSHGLGVSLALGLVAGKGASFISARTSYPLTERFGHLAPFYVATSLTLLSVIVNLVYIACSKWLVDGSGAELEATDIKEEAQRRKAVSVSEAQALERVAKKRKVNLKDVSKLGDVFWAYVGLNILCGAVWSPFLHLAANLIQTRYSLTESDAANAASYLLAWSVLLYPIAGLIVDRFKKGPTVIILMVTSASLTLLAFVWLALPPAVTHTPIPSIALFGFGQGFAPLLLVVIVPKIVSLKYVSTALGVHKSLEQTGSTIFQTLAGLSLDTKKLGSGNNSNAVQHLINVFVILNILQISSIFGLAYLQRKSNAAVERGRVLDRGNSTLSFSSAREREGGEGGSPGSGRKPSAASSRVLPLEGAESGLLVSDAAGGNSELESQPLLSHTAGHRRYSRSTSTPPSARLQEDELLMRNEIRRGKVFLGTSAALIVFAWALFMGTAWFRLGRNRES